MPKEEKKKNRKGSSVGKQVLTRVKRGKTDDGMIKQTWNQRLRKQRKSRQATKEVETEEFVPSVEHSPPLTTSGFPCDNISLVLTDTEGDVQPAVAISTSYVRINYKGKCHHKICKQHQRRKIITPVQADFLQKKGN